VTALSMKTVTFYLAFFVALQSAIINAHAAQSSGCSLGGAAIAFGIYDPLALTPLDTVGSVVYRCGAAANNITITLSVGGGASYSTRRMISGNEKLFYNLYRDAARQVIWGDGTGGSQAYAIKNPKPNNQDITVPIFGRIPASQNVGVGSYSDTITVTLNF